MKDTQLQTPQRDQTSAIRRSKSTSDLKTNPHKVSKKRWNPAFKAVSEDESAILDSLTEFPEASEDDPLVESDENCTALVDPEDTPSSETVIFSDLTAPTLSSFSVITSDDHVLINADTDTKWKYPEADFFDEIKSIKAEVVIKHLREARIQVMKAKELGSSKKILDALINMVIDEFNGGGVFEEQKCVDKFVSKKANMVFLSFMMGSCAILMFWFFSSDAKGFHTTGLTPT